MKTALCHLWQNGTCTFEEKCLFAHGESDIRKIDEPCPFYNSLAGCIKSAKACVYKHVFPSDLCHNVGLDSNSSISEQLSTDQWRCPISFMNPDAKEFIPWHLLLQENADRKFLLTFLTTGKASAIDISRQDIEDIEELKNENEGYRKLLEVILQQ